MISRFFVVKKSVNILSLSYQAFFILFLVFLCKKILGYWGKQLIDYSSDKVAKFHITKPEAIMDGVQKILKTMLHILYSFYLYLPVVPCFFCQNRPFSWDQALLLSYIRPELAISISCDHPLAIDFFITNLIPCVLFSISKSYQEEIACNSVMK